MPAGKGGGPAVGACPALGVAQEMGWRRGSGRRREARGSSRLESRGEKKKKKTNRYDAIWCIMYIGGRVKPENKILDEKISRNCTDETTETLLPLLLGID
jgi:hypothetical protein